MRLFLFLFLAMYICSGLNAQTPTIEGDNILCPDAIGQVSTTQVFDSYQWYQRFFGSTDTQMLMGETNQALSMNFYDFAASYVSVEVIHDGERFFSDEFFVDGYAFAPAVVISEGNFNIVPDGESVLCPGDTMTFTLSLPYTEHIVWYRDGEPISDANQSTLVVTEPGVYSVMGAPEVCPEFLQGPGVPLVVIPCNTTSLSELQSTTSIKVFPNPSLGMFHIDSEAPISGKFIVMNSLGHIVEEGELGVDITQFDLSHMLPGMYVLKLINSGYTIKLIRQ